MLEDTLDPKMRYLDLAIILAYLAGITWFGARFGKGQKNLQARYIERDG